MFLCLRAFNLPTDCMEQAACLSEALVLTDHTFNINNWQCQFPLSSLVEVGHSTLQLCSDGSR